MRTSVSRDLVILILAIAVCRSTASAGGSKSKAEQRPARPIMTWEEKGYGVTESLARANALERLNQDVVIWLGSYHPEITYSPPPDKISALVKEFSPAEAWKNPKKDNRDGEKDNLKNEDFKNEGAMLEVSLIAEITDNILNEYRYEMRKQVAQRRQGLMAGGLLGAVALLAVGTGYLRLEERVGRHKRKLGLAAMGMLGLIGLMLLVLGIEFF